VNADTSMPGSENWNRWALSDLPKRLGLV